MFVWSWVFLWKTLLLTLFSCIPPFIFIFIRNKFNPPTYQRIAD
jgi:hypothetical protein